MKSSRTQSIVAVCALMSAPLAASAASFSTDFSTQPANSQLFNHAQILTPTFSITQDFEDASLTSSTSGTGPTLVDVYDGGSGNGFVAAQWNTTPPASIDTDGSNSYLRLAEAVKDQRNTVAFDRQTAARTPSIDASFDFRITGNNPADGLGFMLLDTDTHGDSGAGPDYFGETPNASDSFGISFDTYKNGSEPNGNHISLWLNGSEVAGSEVANLGLDLSDGTFHRADVSVRAAAGSGAYVSLTIVEDVNGVATPRTIYDDYFISDFTPYRMRPGFGVRTGGASADYDLDNINVTQNVGIDGGVLRLTPSENNRSGGFLLPDLDNGEVVDTFDMDFDFRLDPESTSGADGFSVSLVRSGGSVGSVGERGSDDGIAIEFDTYNNGSAQNDADGNHVGLRYDGNLISLASLNNILTLDSGRLYHARILMRFGNVKIFLTGDDGAEHLVLDSTIADWEAFAGQFNFAARTGGSHEAHYIDNLAITTAVIPEPATLGLLAVGLAMMGRRRR